MVYGFISSLDGDTTKAFFRSKRIPANNIYSAGALGALAEDLKTGDVVKLQVKTERELYKNR